MPNIPTAEELLEAGVHFGHKASKWHPKMEPYIFTSRNGIHIIDLEETRNKLKEALEFLKNSASKGAVVLFLGTKRQARPVIEEAAKLSGSPYIIERWIGGLITNFSEIKRSLKKYQQLKREKESGEWDTKYVKKEKLKKQKEMEKLEKNLHGILDLEKVPDVLFVADMWTEKTALREARRMGVKIAAISDTNVNPELADYPIPANDDAIKSLKMIVNLAGQAVAEGKTEYERAKAEKGETEKKAAEVKKHDFKAEVVASE